MKGYEKYLPEKKNTQTILIQAKIDADLHEEVRQLMDREGLTWHETLSGLLRKLIDDSKKKSA